MAETEVLSKVCASAGVVAVIGLNEQDDREGSATLYNTMLFIDRDGTLLGRHRKLMPTHQEREAIGNLDPKHYYRGWEDDSSAKDWRPLPPPPPKKKKVKSKSEGSVS